MYIKVYKFEELSKQAQNNFYKSRDFAIFCEQINDIIYGDMLPSMERYSNLLDVSVSTGDIIADDSLLELKGIRAYKYIVNHIPQKELKYEYKQRQKRLFELLQKVHKKYNEKKFLLDVSMKQKRRYSSLIAQETVTSLKNYEDFWATGVYTDGAFLDAMASFVEILKRDKNVTFSDFLNIYQNICNNYIEDNCYNSITDVYYISEFFDANNYAFTKSGELVNTCF